MKPRKNDRNKGMEKLQKPRHLKNSRTLQQDWSEKGKVIIMGEGAKDQCKSE